MKTRVYPALLAIVALAPLSAQAPKGWMVREDKSTSATDPDGAGAIKFVTQGSGFHATNPTAAVYWNNANKASGSYTLKGTFTLMKPSGHNNYYGLVFGGSGLEGEQQQYTYFLVSQTGTWLIKKRNGAGTENVAPKTPNDAVKKPDDTGRSTNVLEVRVAGDKVDYVVNGTVVTSTPASQVKPDGIYGIRVNHLLEVQVDNFGVSK